eukprot:12523414-Alexandrium_andersonii.AAC.1
MRPLAPRVRSALWSLTSRGRWCKNVAALSLRSTMARLEMLGACLGTEPVLAAGGKLACAWGWAQGLRA